jgi:hypothetical protein
MTVQYKWLPSEPTDEMMSVFTPLESYRNAVIKDGYKALWQAAPTQVDQTALINQLTDELNKTEAERVKWMTMALTSQPKREPLSDDEVQNLFANMAYPMGWSDLREFVCMIERAHGIGV